MSSTDARRVVARRARTQAQSCAHLGSPLYAGLLERTAVDVETGGPTWQVLEPFADWPGDSAFVLRFMGAVHRLVLAGAAPALAPQFTTGGDPERAWPAFHALIEQNTDRIRALAVRCPVQTNEVGRCAALAPAILWLSGGMPVRLLELGASAGLNLRWDAYRYEEAWGDPASPVRLVDRYRGRRPPFRPPEVEIVERRGCDVAPVDPHSEAGRLTLTSFVWPDQPERLGLLRRAIAIAIAEQVPAVVEAAEADEWLVRVLAEPPPACVTVVFHSIVWQYLPSAQRERIAETITRAGAQADPTAPIAWLRMEPDRGTTRIQATTWPGGRTTTLAWAGFHGRPVTWLTAE